MDISKYCISDGETFELGNHTTIPPADSDEKKVLKSQLTSDLEEIKTLQEMFYAYDRHAILLIFQAMDAAGKDGAIKHVTSGINPQGCQVYSFKSPSANEYKQDFLWRHHKVMPESGRIGIHNRSHYEFVLACKVNPEFILKERIPIIKSVNDIDEDFWKKRYKQIRKFEKQLAQNGTVIMKFFLNVSMEEQKKRLLERIEMPDKNWKFDIGDLTARKQWNEYMEAYEKAIRNTARKDAPWYIIPADDKWFARALIAKIFKKTLQNLDMNYPKLDAEALSALGKAKNELMKT